MTIINYPAVYDTAVIVNEVEEMRILCDPIVLERYLLILLG